MLRAGAENFQAVGLPLRRDAGADLFRKGLPGLADALVPLPGIVVDKPGVRGVLHAGNVFQHLSEDPAVAEHTGQAGHHTVRRVHGVLGCVQHVVHIGPVLRPQGQGLDLFIFQAVALEIVPPGGVLRLVDKGQERIVVPDLLHVAGMEDAPGEHLGVFPEVQAVIHNVALEAFFIQGAVRHAPQERGLHAGAPDGQAVPNTGIQKAHTRDTPFAAFRKAPRGRIIRITREKIPSGILLEMW